MFLRLNNYKKIHNQLQESFNLKDILKQIKKNSGSYFDVDELILVRDCVNKNIDYGKKNGQFFLLDDADFVICMIDENKNITWEKIETAEASGNILVICDELPNIETASTNFIYCLLTPEYQRGLNIGLTNNINANKNHFEEWVVIETQEYPYLGQEAVIVGTNISKDGKTYYTLLMNDGMEMEP